jgi:hypothetical protein
MNSQRSSRRPVGNDTTAAQATDMESEGQGQQNPPPLTLASRIRQSWRRRGSTAPRRSRTPVPIRDTHLTAAQTPRGVGIDAQMPNSMPRAEDDATTRAGSHEFHDRPGSGSDSARRLRFF